MTFPILINAQTIVKGIVKNAANNEPIPYVNIGVFEKGIGTVSNAKGYYELVLQEYDQGGLLSFSHLNFEVEAVQLDQQSLQNLDVELMPRNLELPTMNVGTKKTLPFVLGNNDLSSSTKGFFNVKGLGGEAATLIKNKSICKINSFHFNVLVSSFEKLSFRLNFFSVKKSKPNKLITSIEIFHILKGQTDLVEIPIKDLVIEGDIIVSIELIEMKVGNAEDLRFLFSAYSSKKAKVYKRSVSLDKWRRYKGHGLCFWLEAEK